jgi:hypothetical protein
MLTNVGNGVIANQVRQGEAALAEKTKAHASEVAQLVTSRLYEANVAVADITARYSSTAFRVAISAEGIKRGAIPIPQ